MSNCLGGRRLGGVRDVGDASVGSNYVISFKGVVVEVAKSSVWNRGAVTGGEQGQLTLLRDGGVEGSNCTINAKDLSEMGFSNILG